MIRAIYACAAFAALIVVPVTAKEWSKDKTWTVTELNQTACLMRPTNFAQDPFQIVEATDHSGTISVSGLPANPQEPEVLYYGFSTKPFTALLEARVVTYVTAEHESIDTMLWSLPAKTVPLMGKPALEMAMPRNFLDIYAQTGTALMLSSEDEPVLDGFFAIPGAAGAVAALRECNASRASTLAKGAK